MVTVLMAILIFLGIGWQFAFEQWGILAYYGNGEGMAYTPPLTTTNILIGVAGDNAGMHPVGINNVNIFATGTTGISYILICK